MVEILRRKRRDQTEVRGQVHRMDSVVVVSTTREAVAGRVMPVITEPFEVMAFDLVGPYGRSQHGYKYVLTETVAEAMVEIFSRTGVPQKMLTDQGSQFVGHLNQQLCKKLNIDKIQTSNGCLERWHGTLNPMIKKSIESKKSW